MPPSEEVTSPKDALTARLAKERPHLGAILRELHKAAPDELYMRIDERDGAAKLAVELPKAIKPADVARQYTGGQRVWELFGLFFLHSGRNYEASTLFLLLYDHLLHHQATANTRVHKGVPLYWLAMCHAPLGNTVTAKRHLMLTLCEDAIKDKGRIDLQDSGSYFALVWHFGLPDAQLWRYVETVWSLHQDHPLESRFPEWSLQRLDQEWMTEVPSASEAGLYKISCPYPKWLLDHTEDEEGENLECLAQYLVGAMPGCRALRRVRSEVSDYDVVGIFEGSFMDFRSELGRYFLVECKDWSRPADFTTVAKFCRVLDSAKCRFGILFSREGVSGQEGTRFAQREIVKVFQDRGIVIVVVTKEDLERVADGANFLTMLRSKYEKVRLDLLGAVRVCGS
jgi:hypothetical protein